MKQLLEHTDLIPGVDIVVHGGQGPGSPILDQGSQQPSVLVRRHVPPARQTNCKSQLVHEVLGVFAEQVH